MNLNNNFFISSIASNCAGTAIFRLPSVSGEEYIVQGFLTDEPTINMGNTWESAVPDISSLNDFMQIANEGPVSWISTSKAAWKGTAPITVDLNFYLLSFNTEQIKGNSTVDNMPVSKQAAAFAQLAAVEGKSEAASNGFFDRLKVKIHGGYTPNYFEGNENFSTGAYTEKNLDKKEALIAQNKLDYYSSDFNINDNENNSTIQCIINGGGFPTLWMKKMLLESVTFNPSTVRVGYWNYGLKSNGKDADTAQFVKTSEPLYIRVSLKLRLMHAATVEDAIVLFTGKRSL